MQKILTIRNTLAAKPPHNIVPPFETTIELICFEPLSIQVLDLVNSSAINSCNLDPLPAPIMKNCLPILLPAITEIVNLPLSNTSVADRLKTAILTLKLKKPDLDCAEQLINYRPVSNFPFISNIFEKVRQ